MIVEGVLDVRTGFEPAGNRFANVDGFVGLEVVVGELAVIFVSVTDEFQGLAMHAGHHVEPSLAPHSLLLLVALTVNAVQIVHSQIAVDVLPVHAFLELGLY